MAELEDDTRGALQNSRQGLVQVRAEAEDLRLQALNFALQLRGAKGKGEKRRSNSVKPR